MTKKVIQTLYSGLGGHASVVFSLLDSEFGKEFDNHLVFYGIEEIPLSYKNKLSKNTVSYNSIIKKPKQYIYPLYKFYNLLKRELPHTIIIHNSELVIPAYIYKKRKNKINIIFVEHEPNHIKNRINWFLSKFSLKKADVVVCLNETYKNELLKKYEPSAVIKVIPNGINIENFKRVKKISECKALGIAARITKTKDHKILIEAFSLLIKIYPFLQLKIAGSGDEENGLKEAISQLNLENNIQMLGMLNEDEMIKFLNDIDLYVHATSAETLSTSILQAMACELTVVTSDIKNNQVLIDTGINGYLYKNQSSEDLFQKMKYAIENFEEAKKLGIAARKKVIQNYSNQKMGESYLKLIKS